VGQDTAGMLTLSLLSGEEAQQTCSNRNWKHTPEHSFPYQLHNWCFGAGTTQVAITWLSTFSAWDTR
jgi:hypothetical protein